ncbi:Peptidoglycan-associated lipoprotein [Desulfonema limicola]|uniref:Peptidoglycan-associated lipoprotein n=1 Tax=Desulfonema limicola TaxID=45656 RepID=A0A975B7V2_9BACT|nr:peptidoglycan-associated lipoprotein Pal [Desulfonema limicola]QTA80506.1 Peptidoglycan-associated lipoprotein [Desulfonema limicola]
MQKKLWNFLVLAIVIPGILLTASCSKKVIKDDIAASGLYDTSEQDTQPPPSVYPDDTDTRYSEPVVSTDDIKTSHITREQMAAREKFMNEDIYFGFDQSSLSAEAQMILRRKAEWMKNNPGTSIIIEGHCDERGTTEYNLALGDRRAESVKTFLANLGISVSRIATISYGEEKPLDPGHNEDAWARNRRAHFIIE